MLDPEQTNPAHVLDKLKAVHARLRRITNLVGDVRSSLPTFQDDTELSSSDHECLRVLDACDDIRLFLATSLLVKVSNHVVPGSDVDFVGEVQKSPPVRMASGLRYVRMPDMMLIQVPASFGARERPLIASDMQLAFDAAAHKRAFLIDFSAAVEVPQILWSAILGIKDTLETQQKSMNLVWVPRVVADAAEQNRLFRFLNLRFASGHYFSSDILKRMPST